MGKKIVLYALKILLLALPLLCLKMVQEPTYMVDARLIKTAKQFPPDEDIVVKAYSQKKHTVAIMTHKYYDEDTLAACLNHYYAEYKQDPGAKILEV